MKLKNLQSEDFALSDRYKNNGDIKISAPNSGSSDRRNNGHMKIVEAETSEDSHSDLKSESALSRYKDRKNLAVDEKEGIDHN